MWELKYFRKIKDFEWAESQPADSRLQVPFRLEALGTDTTLRRAMRQVVRWGMLLLFWALRRFKPVVCIRRPFRGAPLVIVSRYREVKAVLQDPDTFRVPYGPEMRTITGGEDFALGIDGPAHDAQREILLHAVRPGDMPAILERTQVLTRALIDGGGGRIDVMRDLVGRVLTETTSEYFGLDLEEPNAFMDRLMATSALLFADPLGNPDTRRLALAGAVRVRHLIDRAIDRAVERAHATGPNDTVMDRLVGWHGQEGQTLTKAEVRAIALGVLTGLIPTTALAAGKILEELQRRPRWLSQAIAAARAAATAGPEDPLRRAHRDSLLRILWEASRLNPALAPGQWRYAARPASLGGVAVPEGAVLMVATMSALRDPAAYPEPRLFNPTRRHDGALMFGTGSHACIGEHLALEQITDIFMVLLAQENIRFSRSAVGQLAYVGPFPRRLDMEFSPTAAPRTQSMILIQAPLALAAGTTLADVQARIARIGNPVPLQGEVGRALTATGIVHFASLSAIDAADRRKGPAPPDPRLIFELNVDGDPEWALARIARACVDTPLHDIFKHVAGYGQHPAPVPEAALRRLLVAHQVSLHTLPYGAIGLNFNGTPDCPVEDIARQQELAAFCRDALDHYLKTQGRLGSRAIDALAYVRGVVRGFAPRAAAAGAAADDADLRHRGSAFRDFLIRPTRRRLAISEWTDSGTTRGWTALWRSGTGLYAGTLLLLAILLQAAATHYAIDPASWPAPAAVAAVAVALGTVLIWAGLAQRGFERLRGGCAALARTLPYVMVAAPLLAGMALAYGVLGWLTALPWIARLVLAVVLAVPGAVVLFVVARVLWRWLNRVARPALYVLLAAALAAIAGALVWHTEWALGLFRLLALIAVSLTGGIVATLLAGATLVAGFLWLLRRYERREIPDERSAPLAHLQAIAATENAPGYRQNHILAHMPLKRGWFRKVTLGVALWGIGKLVRHWYRPGFVLNMGTIHYAQWFRLPGSEQFVFLSNYDGSWESYLEDFITKAHKGQSAAWSNGEGFPPTRFLILDGAQDGDRFKRWVRCQQTVTQLWYSRFPALTTDQIRTNALIHDGLMRAHTDTAARAWLDCFGSMPRPADAIEFDEVQSLVFNGFQGLSYTACAALVLPNQAEARSAWLDRLMEAVRFGEQRPGMRQPAVFVAFSAQGMHKLLLPAADEIADGAGGHASAAARPDVDSLMATFPMAFRMGMAARANVLGDIGASAPQRWRWGDTGVNACPADKAADALLLVYAATPEACTAELEAYRAEASAVAIVHTRPTARTRASGGFYEHFGFRDGISQPVIRGCQRAVQNVLPADLVSAGELILGYRNDAGLLAPAITLPGEADPHDDLDTDTAGFASRFPQFRSSLDEGARDFGRNGTFLAVRQLRQHVDRFEQSIREKADTLNREYRALLAGVGGGVDAEWVAAKMMGRWRDGASLVSQPYQPGAGQTPDNDFDFGQDDPQGLRCPFGAHIRRANARGSLQPDDPAQLRIMKRHRILRRGRTYEADAEGEGKTEKGLMFVGVCADLERQFEFLQQSWIGSPSFHGLTDEPDPIAAGETQGPRRFTIPTPSGPMTIKGLPSFVDVRGGGYFFMPSRSALRFLVNLHRRTLPPERRKAPLRRSA